MSEEATIVHTVVKETSYWTPYIQGWLTAIGTLLAGLIPTFMWWNARQKEKQAQKEAIEIEAKKNAPQYVEKKELIDFKLNNTLEHDSLKSDFRDRNDEMSSAVEASAHKASAAVDTLNQIAREISSNNDSHAKEVREMIGVLSMSVSTSLREVHEKANKAVTEVARLEGRIKAVEIQTNNLLQRQAG